jgi:hypothetical protein
MKRLKQLIAKLRAATGMKFAAAATQPARRAVSIDAGSP